MLVYILFIIGFICLIKGADLLVDGATAIARRLNISDLVIGLTVVAFGTSMPELFVNIVASFKGNTDIAIGNVVGSNIANVLLILGLSALAAPLVVSRQLLRIEVPLMLGVSLLAWAMALDGSVGRLDGTILFFMVLVYTVWTIRRSRRETSEGLSAAAETPSDDINTKGRFTRNLFLILVGKQGN